MSMQTFRWATMPSNARPISTRMVLKSKIKSDGTFDKYKARLCCRGFLQKEGTHYFQTFTPTSNLSIFRSLLAESALNNWSVKHADVKNAFCNARIDVPDLFITMPNGIVCHDPNPSDNARRGILLEKALYGLKQSPRLFFLDIKKLLLDKGLVQLRRDPTAFYLSNPDGTRTYVLVYVDDIVIFGPSDKHCDAVHEILKSKYVIGEYDDIASYLGMNIKRTATGFTLDMKARTESILEELPVKPVPLSPRQLCPRNVNWEIWAGASLDSLTTNELHCLYNYSHLVGAINYLCTTVRPDICLALSKLSQHLCNPTPTQAKHLNHLLQYLAATTNKQLEIEPTSASGLEIFSDSNFADASDLKRRSTSGTVVTYHGRPVLWKSKLQTCTADSTHEAELYAVHQSLKLGLGIRLISHRTPRVKSYRHYPHVRRQRCHCSDFQAQGPNLKQQPTHRYSILQDLRPCGDR